MKTYNSPMLNIVSIKRSDIVTASDDINANIKSGTTGSYFAPGMRGLDDYYEGY